MNYSWRQRKEKRLETLSLAQSVRFEGGVEYRPIPEFPQHRVGDNGTVWVFRWDRKEKGRWKQIKGTEMKSGGHLRVDLGNGSGKTKLILIHRLVLEVFVGPCPLGMEACHEDDNPKNNSRFNLRWDTRQGNVKDRVKGGRTKVSEEQVRRIRKEFTESGKIPEYLVKEFSISKSYVCSIARGHTWKHLL